MIGLNLEPHKPMFRREKDLSMEEEEKPSPQKSLPIPEFKDDQKMSGISIMLKAANPEYGVSNTYKKIKVDQHFKDLDDDSSRSRDNSIIGSIDNSP
jgi:hypothetical protein